MLNADAERCRTFFYLISFMIEPYTVTLIGLNKVVCDCSFSDGVKKFARLCVHFSAANTIFHIGIPQEKV